MVTAIVLINCEREHINDVSQQLLSFRGVTEVFSVAGQYGLVAILRVQDTGQTPVLATGHRAGTTEAGGQAKADTPADRADAPPGAVEPAQPLLVNKVRHHRIVEDGGEFGADRGNAVGGQKRLDARATAGPSEPHQARA